MGKALLVVHADPALDDAGVNNPDVHVEWTELQTCSVAVGTQSKLARIVNGSEGPRYLSGDGGDLQNLPAPSRDHVSCCCLGTIDRSPKVHFEQLLGVHSVQFDGWLHVDCASVVHQDGNLARLGDDLVDDLTQRLQVSIKHRKRCRDHFQDGFDEIEK